MALAALLLASSAHAHERDDRIAELEARVEAIDRDRLQLRGELAARIGRRASATPVTPGLDVCRAELDDAQLNIEGMRAAVALAEDQRGEGRR